MDASNMHLLTLAEAVGRSRYRQPGAIDFPEYMAQFILRASRRVRYDDVPARVRRHIFIIGPPDTTKSSNSEAFLFDYAGAVVHGSPEAIENPEKPTVLFLQSGTTFEAYRGGFEGERFVEPDLSDADWVYCSESSSFFGDHPKEMSRDIYRFNVAMEEGKVFVKLNKMGRASKREIERFREYCEANGITMLQNGGFYYNCRFSAIFCSHPPNRMAEEFLTASGFYGRCVLGRWNPSQTELEAYFDDQFGPGWAQGEQALRDVCALIWRSTWITYNAPPQTIYSPVIKALNEEYRRISDDTGIPFDKVRPYRDTQNVYQLLTVYAVCRQVEAYMAEHGTVGTPRFSGVEYTEADAAAVLEHYRKRYLDPIRLRADLLAGDDNLQPAIDALRRTVGDRIKETPTHKGFPLNFKYEELMSGELTQALVAALGVSAPTARSRVARLREAGHVERIRDVGRETLYRVNPAIIRDLGGLPSADVPDDASAAPAPREDA